jgi:hypothetical protein
VKILHDAEGSFLGRLGRDKSPNTHVRLLLMPGRLLHSTFPSGVASPAQTKSGTAMSPYAD